MKVTYYGHSCFSVEAAGKALLFDPYITENELAKDIDVNRIRADYILLSHAHSDHVGDAISIAQRTGATIVSNFEITVWFQKHGVAKTHPMNHGGAWRFEFGRVKYTPAIHTSSFADGTYGGQPGGFVVETADGHFYYSGDTALTMDMKLIGESTPLNFAALCIGDNFTMGVEDAIKAAEFVKCKRIVGMHYDTFPFIRIDHAAAVQRFAAAGLELKLMRIGETIAL